MTREDKRAYNYARDRLANEDYPVYSDEYELKLAYKAGIEDARNHPHWISVEDELPPKKSEYDGLSNNVLATDGKEIYESVYNHDFEDWFTHDMWGLDNITHWCYLPQLPVLSNSENTGKDLKGGEG